MATIQKITIPAGSRTILVKGDGRRVLIQGNSFYLGESDVNSDNGIFINKDNKLIDLGNVSFGETLYAFSKKQNTLTVFYYKTMP